MLCWACQLLAEKVYDAHVQHSSRANLQLSRVAQPSQLGSKETAGVPDKDVRGATESPAQSEGINQAALRTYNEGSMPYSQLKHLQARPLSCHTRHV